MYKFLLTVLILLSIIPILANDTLSVLNSNSINITVIFEDGVTPVSDLPIRLWSKSTNKMIYRGKTDKNGVFVVPKIDNQLILFIGSISIDMLVLNTEKTTDPLDLIIAIPKKMMPSIDAHVIDALYVSPCILQLPESPKIVSP